MVQVQITSIHRPSISTSQCISKGLDWRKKDTAASFLTKTILHGRIINKVQREYKSWKISLSKRKNGNLNISLSKKSTLNAKPEMAKELKGPSVCRISLGTKWFFRSFVVDFLFLNVEDIFEKFL